MRGNDNSYTGGWQRVIGDEGLQQVACGDSEQSIRDWLEATKDNVKEEPNV